MSFLFAVLAATVLQFGSVGHCADDPAQDFVDHLTGGTWQLEQDKASQDTYRPILGGKFTLLASTGYSGSGQSVGVLGQHPVTKSWKFWVFHDDGGVEVLEMQVERKADNELLVNFESDLPDKTGLAYTFQMAKDSAVMEGIGKVNGQQLLGKMVWNRIELADQNWLDAEPPTQIPPQMTFAKHTLGPKWMKTTFDGQPAFGSSYGKWILGGKFFLYSATRIENAVPIAHVVVVGRNPGSGRYGSWEFVSNGAVVFTELSEDGLSISGELVGGDLPVDDETLHFEGKFEVVAGELQYTSAIGPEGGERTAYRWNWYSPPGAQAELGLASPKEQAAADESHDEMPAEIRQSLEKDYIGQWDLEFVRGDIVTRGKSVDTWSPDKQSVRTEFTEYTEEGPVRASELLGWDAESKQIVISGFGKGAYWQVRYPEFTTTENGTRRYSGSWHGFLSGKPDGSTCSIEFSGNTFEYRDMTGGKPFVVKGTRVKEESPAYGTIDPREKVKELAFLIGEWEYTDNNGKVRRCTSEWINNRSFIREIDGDVTRVIGWDVQENEFAQWTFGGLGGLGRASFTKEQNGWRISHDNYYLASGKPVPSQALITVIDEDTQRVTGQFMDSQLDIVMRRILPANSGK